MIVKDRGLSVVSDKTSGDILRLLAEKHKGDVFVPECKNGQTWSNSNLLRLDAWCLKRSYSPLTTIGYEIKVSRSDFEQDQKWVGYLDYCHQFYFVCPAGLIRSVDLPHDVGLIWVSASNRLHTKKIATQTKPDTLKVNELLWYVLMSRCQIAGSPYIHRDAKQINTEAMISIVKSAEEGKYLASFVNGHIRKRYDEMKEAVNHISERERNVQEFTDRLQKLGIIWNPKDNSWHETESVTKQINALRQNIGWRQLQDMKELSARLSDAVRVIEEIQRGECKRCK